MRILLFSSSYAPRHGGLEMVTQKLAAELTERGNIVTIVTNRYPLHLAPHASIGGVTVYRHIYPNLLPGPGRKNIYHRVKDVILWPLAPVTLIRLFLLTRRLRPDVVNIHYFSYPAIYMIVVARIRGIPIVLSFHGSDVPNVGYSSNHAWTFRQACRAARVFTTCSSHLRDHVLRLIPAHRPPYDVIVAQSGIGEDEIPAFHETTSSTPSVLVVSRLVPKKGIEVVIDSMAVLRARSIDVELHIAGDGPCLKGLKERATHHRVSDNVRFHGFIEGKPLTILRTQATIAVVPSLWEAFGIVCLEAMMARKPVIASDVGGLPEMVVHGETGLLVPPGSAEDLANAIEALLDDPISCAEMGRRGRLRAETIFTWENMTDRYVEAFSRALREPQERFTGSGVAPS